MARLIIFFSMVIFSCFHSVLTVNAQSPSVLVEGSGLPVVMIPGGNFSISIFDVHAKALSTQYKIIRIDRLNVIAAKTNLPLPENYSVRMESEAIAKQLDSINIKEPVYLIGHSYGGLIALDFALNHPERIRALVLVEPPVFWLPLQRGEHPKGLDEVISVSKDFGPNSQIREDQLEKFRCALGDCPNGRSARDNPQWATWVKNISYLRGLSAVVQCRDSISSLKTFLHPVMIVTGNQTVSFHKRIDELLSEELPNNIQIKLEGGHVACVTNSSTEFIQAVKFFLQSNK